MVPAEDARVRPPPGADSPGRGAARPQLQLLVLVRALSVRGAVDAALQFLPAPLRAAGRGDAALRRPNERHRRGRARGRRALATRLRLPGGAGGVAVPRCPRAFTAWNRMKISYRQLWLVRIAPVSDLRARLPGAPCFLVA